MKEILSLFPTPVYVNDLNRDLTSKEKSFIEDLKKQTINNKGNSNTKNVYILNEPSLRNLNKDIKFFIKDYFDTIIETTDQIFPYITQSWLNYTEKNGFHHLHNHTNSYVSGVLYLDVKENDSITFYKNDNNDIFSLNRDTYNAFNCFSWTVPVKKNQILLFPSYLKHAVLNKDSSGTRISLAFNTFIKGTFGAKYDMVELKL
jgi:uncharacterized protein (TIGR02466 family)